MIIIKKITLHSRLHVVTKPTISVIASMLALLWIAGIGTARATLIDPNFIVCNSSSLTSSCGVDPNPINSSGSFYAGVQGNSGAGPIDPFLLLVATPSTNSSLGGGATFSSGSYVVSGTNAGGSLTVTAATTAQYGQTTTLGSDGYLGQFTSSDSDLYAFAGLAGGNNSFNWANMAGTGQNGTAEQTLLGYTPDSFSVYEYTVDLSSSTGNLGTDDIYKILYNSIPLGSYVAAWGIEQYPIPTQGNDFVYDSAFTVGGWVNDGKVPPQNFNVPEPATLALFAIGLFGVGFMRRRRVN